jgi:hypothetical protein
LTTRTIVRACDGGVLSLAADCFDSSTSARQVYGGLFGSLPSNVIALLLNSRGFMELVIATIAYQAGLIDLALFSIVVGIGVMTTIISP